MKFNFNANKNISAKTFASFLRGLELRSIKLGSPFTLVELLIVISIMLILLSMLLPALKQAKETSMNVSCKNNMRQIGIAFLSYTTDYNGFLPPYDYGGWGGDDTWLHILLATDCLQPHKELGTPFSYSEVSNATWLCPKRRAMFPAERTARIRYSDYAVNALYRVESENVLHGPFGAEKSYRIMEMPEPSNVALMLEHSVEDAGWYWIKLHDWPTQFTGIYLHNNGFNTLFADGHVSFRKGKDYLKRENLDYKSRTH